MRQLDVYFGHFWLYYWFLLINSAFSCKLLWLDVSQSQLRGGICRSFLIIYLVVAEHCNLLRVIVDGWELLSIIM